jgi:hypothetical protein
MAKGKKTGGRKKGSRNKSTIVQEQELAASGELPRDYMLRIMRDPEADDHRRDEMAKAMAPYVHSRFATIPHTGDSEKPTQMVMRVEFVRAKDGRPAPPDDLPDDLPADLPADLPPNVTRMPLGKTG